MGVLCTHSSCWPYVCLTRHKVSGEYTRLVAISGSNPSGSSNEMELVFVVKSYEILIYLTSGKPLEFKYLRC